MITKKLIEKIEGEAELFLEKKHNQISFATVSFGFFRGFDTLLHNKNPLDALVYTPRICGICGHSHLYATALALEDAYRQSGLKIEVPQKAKEIREITLILEIVQNHIKWLYFVLIGEIQTLTKESDTKTQLKGAYCSAKLSSIIALFSGQYPHASYMLPGGITSDITHIELLKAQTLLDELIIFLEKELFGTEYEAIVEFSTCKDFNTLNGTLKEIEADLIKADMHTKGFGYDRFLTLGEHSFNTPAKIKKTIKQVANTKYISTQKSYAPHKKSYALNALYKEEYIEVGPLARAMANNYTLIKNIHRRYKDSTYSRVIARIYEIPLLLLKVKKLLNSLDVTTSSYAPPPPLKKVDATGIGVVEAPRGVLLHTVTVKNNQIKNYEIITPTQFNLASGTKKYPSLVQKALNGVDEKEVSLIFRSFDVCSVCTTH